MRADVLEVLLGHKKADLVIRNAQIVDVLSGKVNPGGVAVRGDRVVKIGDVEDCVGPDTASIDARGRYLTPGLIETHLHAYETNLNLTEFARILLRRGTTAVPEAMYGGGQIRGLDAVRFFIGELSQTPMNVLIQVPVLGYLQNLELGLPAGPNSLTGDDLFEVLSWEGCVALEEPPYIPLKEKDPVIVRLMDETLKRGKVVMGHGAGLTGNDLDAYAAAGVTADHEGITAEEALERIRAGILVSMRESDVAHNQRDIQKAITEHGASTDNFMYCADVLDPVTAVHVGHLDHCIALAIEDGVDPIAAVQMATINAARYYRVDHNLGSVSPGKQADILLVGDLNAFDVQSVIVKGQPVILDGEFVARLEQPIYPAFLQNTVTLARPVGPEDFRLEAPSGRSEVTVRVIGGELLVSDERHIRIPVVNGNVESDTNQDVLKIAMLDRYGRSDQVAIGFLQGYKLKRGALGTTYNPMYHNVVVMGTNDADMAVAANALAEMGGGFVAVDNGTVVGAAPLGLLGLMSEEPAETFIPKLEALYERVRDMGCTMPSPYHNLAFTCVCGELPFLKLSHLGLFDVARREVLPTIVETGG